MCGIAGFIDRSYRQTATEFEDAVAAMANAIRHRGPDDAGVWMNKEAGVALGHRRLSILDLSPEGHQPMISRAGRFIIVFNGEIYNFQDLRRDLQGLGHTFRGHSDTEIMLAAFEEWGVAPSTAKFNGMFAYAVWDREDGMLYLGRDRLGKKPLYYGWSAGTFLFGSELKALQAFPGFNPAVDPDVVALFLRHGYIPSPYSIYKGIHKLPPACILEVRESDRGHNAHPVPYWSSAEAVMRGREAQFRERDEALENLDALLRDAVQLRMVSDVPLGAFLSGGIDSSLIVALMQAQSTRPVRTFSIGFEEASHNEAEHAKAVAQHLGTDHTELYVTPQQVLDVVPLLPRIFDEPFADASQVPTYLVSELARRHVTVSLSGDGGDELFAGYSAYFSNMVFEARYGHWPAAARSFLGQSLQTLSAKTWDGIFGAVGPVLPQVLRQGDIGGRLHRLGVTLSQTTPERTYMALVSLWERPELLVPGSVEPVTAFTRSNGHPSATNFIEKMMFVDTMAYLPDDILVKVDRASMAVSLEARAPLLDYRVFEYAWRVPLEWNIRKGHGKAMLRDLLYRYVPRELVDRPKTGFSLPVSAWLRGPLRTWAENLLSPSRLSREGIFNSRIIQQTWMEHLSGRYDWSHRLWCVLMFQLWLQTNQTSCSSSVPAGCSPAQI